ncbi:unnamed protein product [Didymodactylos carnosus]|uniref:Uncharacterized protein n=1 Tax=Didymodactylos carnosus TaxID=1234261 RepID=A0A814PK72_9BILA|nr:unnamed protein product [Didymodactylos carnosus]CAF3871761.1 unnamed protein product [Didymodactylos carnosus]
MSESTCQVLDLLVEPFTGGYQFQALSSLCQFSMKTVEDSLFQFNSNTLVTANLLPNKVFQQEAQSLIDLFTSETLNNFNRLFDLIRGTTFDNQLSQYSNLICPCDERTIKYDQFLKIQPLHHQICANYYITDRWIDALHNITDKAINRSDFRWTAMYFFQTLTSFCQLSNETVLDSLIEFYSTELITSNILSNETFRSQANSFINLLISETPLTFRRSLELIRISANTNQLMSGILTNYNIQLLFPNYWFVLGTSSVEYKTCNCNSSSCIQQAAFLEYNTKASWNILGLNIGCYVVDAVLAFNLESEVSQKTAWVYLTLKVRLCKADGMVLWCNG